jgi:hypothetical protein
MLDWRSCRVVAHGSVVRLAPFTKIMGYVEKLEFGKRVNYQVRLRRLFVLPVIAISVFSIACGTKTAAPASLDLKSLTASKFGTLNYIDTIAGKADFHQGPATYPRTDELTIIGWAVDSTTKLPATKVFLDLDGKLYPTQYGIARPDVSAVFKEPAYTNSGFIATLPSPSGDGEHRVIVNIVSSGGTDYYSGVAATFRLK